MNSSFQINNHLLLDLQVAESAVDIFPGSAEAFRVVA